MKSGIIYLKAVVFALSLGIQSIPGAFASESCQLQPLHQAMELGGVQRPFEEICRRLGPGKTCSYQAFVSEGSRSADPVEIVAEIQKGMLGRIKLSKEAPSRLSPEQEVVELLGRFRGMPGLPAAQLNALKQELLSGLRSLRSRDPKRFSALFWSPVDHGKGILILLQNRRYETTEIGVLLFGESVETF